MKVKDIIDIDFLNYKKPSMYIAFPYCSFKCEKDCMNQHFCQNSSLVKQPSIEVTTSQILARYKEAKDFNTQALVLCGLEPFDSKEDLFDLISRFRKHFEDDIVIYTGYTETELYEEINYLKQYSNIVIKFGRFVPGQEKHYDDILGVYLASNNQYARKIS